MAVAGESYCAKQSFRQSNGLWSGGQGRNRTSDTVIFSHVLYQLSYLALAAKSRAGIEFGV
jgi:hypothetical protein